MKLSKTLFLVFWSFILPIFAQVSYVDADPSTNVTLADGTALNEGVVGYDLGTAVNQLWDLREFGNNNTLWQGGLGEDCPALRVTISGLNAGETYEIYAFTWNATGQNWAVRASLTDPGAGEVSEGWNGNHPAVSGFNTTEFVTGHVTNGDNDGPLSTDTGGDPGLENGGYFTSADIETIEGNRSLYQATLGQTTANASGEIFVYIDDATSGANLLRTFFDGVGYVPVSAAPSFVSEPSDTTVTLGTDVTLRGKAISTETVSYQWQKDGSNLAGETDVSLTITAADADDAGSYALVATTPSGTTSSMAELSVVVPEVTPNPQVTIQGFDAEFTISLPVGQTYSYQWKKDGVDIVGATSETLVISAVTTADSGDYTVDVTLVDGPVTSPVAELIVPPDPTEDYPTTVTGDSPVAFLRLDETMGNTAADSIAPEEDFDILADVVLDQSGAIAGLDNASMRFNGGSDAYLETSSSEATLNSALFSVEFWARPTGGTGRRTIIGSRDVVSFDPDVFIGYEVGINPNGQWEFRLGAEENEGGPRWNSVVGTMAEINFWTHIVASFDGSAMVLYVNGAPVSSLSPVSYFPQTFNSTRVGAGVNESVPPEEFFIGDLDEVAFYDRALLGSEVVDHYAAAFDPNAPPFIITQPRTQAIVVDNVANLEVVASGAGLTYQWRKGNTDLPGETGSTLTFDPLEISDAGDYTVVISNANGSTTSDVARLFPLRNLLGDIVVPDETNTVFSIDGFSDWFVVNNQNAARSQGVWNQRPVFAIVPGLTPYGYQLDNSTNGGINEREVELETTISGLTPGIEYVVWTLVSDKTNFVTGVKSAFAPDDGDPGDQGPPLQTFLVADMLDTGEISVSDTDPWRVLHAFLGPKVADSNGEIKVRVDYAQGQSNFGNRTVYNGLGYQLANPTPQPPTISVSPVDQTALVETSATFNVIASSLRPLIYQWQKDGVDIPGADQPMLTIDDISGDDAGQYQVVVTNDIGSVTSDVAILVPVNDLVGTFVFPNADNTILVRDDSLPFSTATSLGDAETNGVWFEDPNLALPGEASSTHGFFATDDTALSDDPLIRTTLGGLDSSQMYAVWVLYGFEPTSFSDRIQSSIDGDPLRSYDNSRLDTGRTTGANNEFVVHHGLLGILTPNASGEIAVQSSFEGLQRSILLGYGYQTTTLPPVLDLAISNAGGNITLTWPEGILQQSTDLGENDDWEDIPGATSPFIYTGGEEVIFFRVRQ